MKTADTFVLTDRAPGLHDPLRDSLTRVRVVSDTVVTFYLDRASAERLAYTLLNGGASLTLHETVER